MTVKRLGILYVVATPIGNLDDWSKRAVVVLKQVDLLVVERAAHSRVLLNAYAIDTPYESLANHNESVQSAKLCQRLLSGQSLALISDAGTPLISDPGYRLVALARSQGITVSTVPGPCAAIAALSISGLPTDRFAFEGFLPAKSAARRQRIQQLYSEPRTWIVYEAPHRIVHTLVDMCAVLGKERQVVLARELTKCFEQVVSGPVSEVHAQVLKDANLQRGEMVVLVAGYDGSVERNEADIRHMLGVLLATLPLGKAVQIAAKLSGQSRADINELARQVVEGGYDSHDL